MSRRWARTPPRCCAHRAGRPLAKGPPRPPRRPRRPSPGAVPSPRRCRRWRAKWPSWACPRVSVPRPARRSPTWRVRSTSGQRTGTPCATPSAWPWIIRRSRGGWSRCWCPSSTRSSFPPPRLGRFSKAELSPSAFRRGLVLRWPCRPTVGKRSGARSKETPEPTSVMKFDHYTVKSQEALERAQRLARDHGQQQLTPEHLLVSLLQDPEGISGALLEQLGVSKEALERSAMQAMERLPRVEGGSLYLGDPLRQVLEAAETQAEKIKDEYVSVEHLLLALAAPEPGSGAQEVLARAGVTPDAWLQALAQ